MHGKKIGLALQGGGSYAAFTCGVLRALFKNDLISNQNVHSISGTSGGALNAALLGLALHENKKDPVEYVNKLWQINRIEKMLKERFSAFNMLPDRFIARLIGVGRKLKDSMPTLSAAFENTAKSTTLVFDLINEIFHDSAPSLPKDLTSEFLEDKAPFVTVASTEAKSGRAHYFTNNKSMINKYSKLAIGKYHQALNPLSLNGVFASISHPIIFKSLRMNNNIYWDGYYTSNPPFIYLFREGCDEVILIRLVQINRDEISEDLKSVSDRIEEIVQNSVINMEILTYFSMREILYNNIKDLKKANLELSRSKFSLDKVFHEIRLLKQGNIKDEGFPLSGFVDRLISLGEKVILDKQGFSSEYAKSKKGMFIVSSVDFETEEVRSQTVDYDRLLFEED